MIRLYKLILLCTLYSLQFWNNIVAQSNTDLQAIALYNKAEQAFGSASYEDALKYLNQAEELLGTTNSKILYLKIQTLNLLFKIDIQKAQQLQAAINQFYEVTNPDNYSKEKYVNITSIEIDLKRHLKAHEADYLKLKGSEDVSEYEAFFSNYPGSKYEAQLKAGAGYRKALETQKIAQQKAFEQNWKAYNLPLLKEYQRKGGAMVGIGSAFLIIGTGGLAFSVYDFTEGIFDGEGGSGAFLGGAAAFTITGLFLVPYGAKHLKEAKTIKRDAREKGIQLSYAPIISPVTQKYGVGLCMKF